MTNLPSQTKIGIFNYEKRNTLTNCTFVFLFLHNFCIVEAWVVPAVSAVDETVSAHSQPEYVHTDHNNNNAIGKYTKTSKSHKNNASEHSRTSSASETEIETETKNQSVNEAEAHASKHNRHAHESESEHAPESVSETETVHEGAPEHTIQRTPTNKEEGGNPPAANA